VDAITDSELITARVTRLAVLFAERWNELLNLTDLILNNDLVTQGIASVQPYTESNFY
jgi:hypothetical protein